ncbi:hypothetical protein VKT23_010067 [Stygiomarasmius scandens]|uniref:DJ-1/PfpI domain-containing protein n=1 Tax=Marasmiellus scandens TaxID=2682957 RepID=A0ABR1JGA7_9AGAR
MSITLNPPPELTPGPRPKTTYTLAVCLYPQFTMLDYQGPIEILTAFPSQNRQNLGFIEFLPKFPDIGIEPDYLSHTNEPVEPLMGPNVVPTGTYKQAMEEGKQYDLLLIPGGNAHPGNVDPSLMEFIKNQYPKAKHILTVCTGSWILAGTGLLNGKKATTNKMLFKTIQECTKDLNINWVPKARWMVTDDKKIWTGSGVIAGMDLANAFMEYFVGKEFAYQACMSVEFTSRGQDDDEWASVHGLV